MVDDFTRPTMRSRALVLSALIVISSLSTVIASDTVTTQDVELSGNYTMTGNYTVSHGTTLTIKPGSVIDMQDYWMSVEGNLVANNVTIMSSIQTTSPGSHNAGVWDDITITQLGTANLDNVTISNAKSCLIVNGMLNAKSLTLEDCLIGMEVSGSSDVDGLEVYDVDNDGVRNTGTSHLSNLNLQGMTAGISSSGVLHVTNGNFAQTGTGISLVGGTADIETLTFASGVGNAVSILSGVSGSVEGMVGSATNAIVAIDSTGFSISDVNMTGDRLVNSWSAGDLSISNAVFESQSGETPIDIRTSSDVILSDISLTGQFGTSQNTYNAPWIGMSLAGSGDYHLDNLTIEASDTALIASGTGTLAIKDSTFKSERLGLSFSGISATTIDNSDVNISSDGEMGIDILQGLHQFENLRISMPFNQFETDSTGLEAWWCDIEATEITVTGFADSLSIYESILTTSDLNLLDSSVQGLYASSSMVHVSDSMETRVSDYGINLVSSTAVLRTWTSSYHEVAGNIDSGSELTVWSMTSTSNLNSDTSGDGVLNYGTSQNLNLQSSTNNRLWEMQVDFEDLSNNPVDADWQVLGFSGTATSGTAYLPISEAGSKITATFAGVGAISNPVGIQGGSHTMQVPIMPQGDWDLVAGTTVVLGPTEDGSPHQTGGNITIPANAELVLQGTTLKIPESSQLIVDSYGDFEGMNSEFIGDIISHSALFGDSESSNLTVNGDVFWTSCQNDMNLFNLHISGNVTLDNSCKVTIDSGSTPTSILVGTGAVFQIQNTLNVVVLDKGEPVQGATITVQGQTVSTDSNGMATKSTTSLLVDSSGTTTSGLEQVTMQLGQITDYLAWDTTSSLDHTFIASTISGGTLSEWLVLEKAWSPYHLTSDLVIPQGQTMTLNDGVFLRVGDQVEITVEGTFNSGFSTISSLGSGARWGGLVIGNNVETSAHLLGTSLVEGAPLVSVDGKANVVISNAYLARTVAAEPILRTTNSANATVEISSTMFSDSASHCLEVQGKIDLSMNDVTMQNCASSSVWARGVNLAVDGLSVQQIVDLDGVTGEIVNLVGESVEISNLNGFKLINIELESIVGTDNRQVTIDGGKFSNAPAIDMDNTAGEFTDLEIDCQGSGTAITAHHGRASAPLVISQSTITSCTKGIDLHTDGESAPVELRDVEIHTAVAVSSEGSGISIHGGTVNGSVDISSAVANLFDVSPTSYSVSQGEIRIWSTHIFDIRLNGQSHEAELEVSVSDYWSENLLGSSVIVALPNMLYTETDVFTYDVVEVVATSEGMPETTGSYEFGLDKEEIITINMLTNQPPTVEIIIPDDGFTIMETLPIEIRAVISDDLDSESELDVVWSVVIGQTEVMKLFGPWNNVTDLQVGMYVLNVEVTDLQGQTATDSIFFEVTMLDTDGDWGATCDIETWYDKEESVYCGPDSFDANDDNDRALDIADAWPTDPCASIDTDNDGQPDDLHCPLGATTWLIADQDDDGDGIPDVLDGQDSSEESDGSGGLILLVFIVVIMLAAATMIVRRKNEGE